MTETQYKERLNKIKVRNEQRQYRKDIREEKGKYRNRRRIETSKFLALYLFGLLNTIVIYAMVAMWRFGDLSYLGVLITDIAAQILIYGIYCLKAYKSKKSEEDMKYKRETNSLEKLLNAGADCDSSVDDPIGAHIELCGMDNENIAE